jgi:hypothetical protein
MEGEMSQEDLTTRVAKATQQTIEQVEITINAISYVFNRLKQRGYSYETVCKMMLEAVDNPQSEDEDIRFIANWLKSA